jgi:hypothetical protein
VTVPALSELSPSGKNPPADEPESGFNLARERQEPSFAGPDNGRGIGRFGPGVRTVAPRQRPGKDPAATRQGPGSDPAATRQRPGKERASPWLGRHRARPRTAQTGLAHRDCFCYVPYHDGGPIPFCPGNGGRDSRGGAAPCPHRAVAERARIFSHRETSKLPRSCSRCASPGPGRGAAARPPLPDSLRVRYAPRFRSRNGGGFGDER